MPATVYRRTPGVYITEIAAFPPSAVGVQGAVPAFIGYTEKAEIQGEPVHMQAIKVGSMADYETIFGAGYKPPYDIKPVEPGGIIGPPPFPPLPRFNLYDSLRLFYANGGGDCYIVSVGSYETGKSGIDSELLAKGLDVIRQVKVLNQNLVAALPLLGDVERTILETSCAPVVQPADSLTGEPQGDLNVPVNGALDGSSRDYRYLQVRRTLIYIEQSIEAALAQLTFARNDANTWSTVVSMVSSFLQGVWSQGGLMGSTAGEAFSVQCGLGSTMTAQDILDGYMRVQVLLQMIRPLEFIELTFKQKMAGV